MNRHVLAWLLATVLFSALAAFIEPRAVVIVLILGGLMMLASWLKREEGMYHLTSDEERRERNLMMETVEGLSRGIPHD